MSGRYIGRYAVTDTSRRMAGGNEIHIHVVDDAAPGRHYVGDTGTITRVATFPGNAHAEREGDKLHILSAAAGQNPGWRQEGNVGPYSNAGRGLAPGAGPNKLATFHGHHYSTEVRNGELHVLEHRDEKGMPAQRPDGVEEEGTSGIRSSAGGSIDTRTSRHAESAGVPRTIADLVKLQNQYFEKLRAS